MALEDDIKAGKIEAQEFRQVIMDLDSTFKSLAVTFAESITNQTKDANTEAQKLAKSYSQDLTNGIKAASAQNEVLETIQKSLNAGNKITAAQQKQIAKAETTRLVTLRKISQAEQEGIVLSAEQLVALEENFKKQNKITGAIEERAKAQEKSLGAVGKISGAFTGLLDKLGMGELNKFFNLDKANAESKKFLEGTGKNANAFKKIGVVSGNIVKNLDLASFGAGALFKLAGALFDQFKKADQSTTDIARGLSMSTSEAKEFKKEMMETSGGITSLNVSLKEQKKTVMALNKELGGTAIAFNKDILAGAADTLNRLHLSEEAVGNMAKQAMVTGKSFKALEKSQAKGVLDAEREFGIRLKLSDVLDESNKITGLARVNAMGIEGGLSKAVATAKSLGIEMAAVAGSAGQLLDFESSITKELEAEMLIGRDLNLEKARAAALANDQEALAKALVEEAGSLEELQSMNVIQQQALAGALGMSAEAPVLVVKELENREFIGGAAIVASHVKALGAECHYISVVGKDNQAKKVSEALKEQDINIDLCVDESRPTTYKTRYMVENQKLFRVSKIKEHKVSKNIEQKIIEKLINLAPNIDGILVSDFVYGTITSNILDTILKLSKEFGIKLYGDIQCSSQVGKVTQFNGFDLITPTEKEARIALDDNESGIEWLANTLLRRTKSKNMLIKLGADGFIAYGNDKFTDRQDFPALTVNPVDVAGAGDSLFAVMSVCLSSGSSLVEASLIGSCMASLAVKEVGNNPISKNKLSAYIKKILN